jgi:hypothetical protein
MRSRGRGRGVVTGMLAVLAAGALAGPAGAQDTRVQDASPASPFSQNKQNEPAVAIDQRHPNILAAGANDNIDMEACNAGTDNTCPFTDGVGVSGISFSSNNGKTWHQPNYTGLTARGCLGVVGDSDPPCTPTRGPIGTLPKYFENNLVSDGDPALAFGPVYLGGGRFSDSASRLYYANLAAALPGTAPFKGAEAIAVSRTDDLPGAMAGDNNAWMRPVIASHQTGALFSDKEQIWADNARSSPHYGNVYVCYAAFRGNGPSGNQPLDVLTSHNGGSTWKQHQVTPATNNIHSRNGFGRSGCTVRTGSDGVVYVFDFAFGFSATTAAAGQIQMIKSTDGGDHWSRPVNIFTAFDTCNYFEASIGRCVEDGVAGARSDLSPAPSVDIANGAPSGAGATNRIVISWVDGRDGLNREHVMFSRSSNGGTTWTTPIAVERPNPRGNPARDRGYYSAPAISPDGRDVYLVYNAFDTPFRPSAVGPNNDRQLVGVVLHADWPASTAGAFSEIHRGATGDARGSSQNDLAAEFLGDYVYAAATNSYGAAVWNDVRAAADCPAIDLYRQSLHDEAVATGQQTAEAEEPRGAEERDPHAVTEDESDAPDVQQECPPNFGNSDIFGGSWSDPSPDPTPVARR